MASKHVVIDEKLFLDVDREERTLVPEVIYAPNKSNEELALAIDSFISDKGAVFVSRLDDSQSKFLAERFPNLNFNTRGRTSWYGSLPSKVVGSIGLISAGTSDLGILEEARSFLEYLEVSNHVFADVGVASIGRLLSQLPEISKVDVILVFAGMEGALPSVLGGLSKAPIIAIPTSTGYGVSAGGFVALASMLSSCSPGLLAVNIDNGIGGVSAAIRILGIKR